MTLLIPAEDFFDLPCPHAPRDAASLFQSLVESIISGSTKNLWRRALMYSYSMCVTSCQQHTLPSGGLNIQRLFSSYQKVQICISDFYGRAYFFVYSHAVFEPQGETFDPCQIASTQGTWYNAHREIETRQFLLTQKLKSALKTLSSHLLPFTEELMAESSEGSSCLPTIGITDIVRFSTYQQFWSKELLAPFI